MRILPLIIILLQSSYSFANELDAAKQLGRELASSVLGQVHNNVKQDINYKNPTSNTSVADSINFKGTDIPEINYTHDNMEATKSQKAADKNNLEASIVSSSFLRAKEYPISIKDSFLDKARDAQKNPENYVDWLSGKYTDCEQEGGEDVLSKSSHFCDEYKLVTEKSCSVGRNIEVDVKHRYECSKKINKFEKVCEKSLVITFDKQLNCNAGSLEFIGAQTTPLNLINGNYLQDSSHIWKVSGSYNYPIFAVNVAYDRSFDDKSFDTIKTSKKIAFNIKDKSQIISFIANSISITGVASVTLNGKHILGSIGEPYTLTSETLKTASCKGGCVFYYINGVKFQNWGKKVSTTETIDLLPHIKDGINEIVLTGIPTRQSAIDISFEVRQICLNEKESWLEQCREVSQ